MALNTTKTGAVRQRAPGAGRPKEKVYPIMQVRPVIKKRHMTTMVGRDFLRGITAQPLMKGVQCQLRQEGLLDEDGRVTAPFVARTIHNYETTENNAFVREGICDSDRVYEMLFNHPARQKVIKKKGSAERTKPGRFVLAEYVPELTDEEEVMALAGSNGGYEEEISTFERSNTTIMGNTLSRDILDRVPEAMSVPGAQKVKETSYVDSEEEVVV